MSKYAQVIIYVNPFEQTIRQVRALKGSRLGDALRHLGIADTFNIKAWVDDKLVDRNYTLKGGQVCTVKVVPKADYFPSGNDAFAIARGSDNGGGGSSQGTGFGPPSGGGGYAARPSQGTSWGSTIGGLMPWIGGAAGIAGLIGGMFFGKTSNQPNAVSSQFVTEPNPAIDYSYPSDTAGAQDSLTYAVTGLSNQENPWGEFVSVFGEDVRVFPVKGMKTNYVPVGDKTYSYNCFDLGYGPLEITGLKIGSRDISEFAGQLTTEFHYGKADDVRFTIPLADIVDKKFSIPMVSGQTKTVEAGAAATQIALEFELPRGLWVTSIYFPTIKTVHTLSFGIYYKKKGDVSYTAAGSLVYTDLIEKYKRLSYSFNVPSEGVYDVQVVASSGFGTFPYGVYNSGEASANWINLKAYGNSGFPFRKVVDSKGDEVFIARIATQGVDTAEQQGASEQLSCLASRLLRHWTGTEWTAPQRTSNPADIVLEIMTGQANFEPVAEDEIDLASFKAWYDYCVANNFKYRKVVDQGVSTRDLINEVCAAGRAARVTINGKHTIIIDEPKASISQHFTLRTIIKDSFTAQASLGKSPNVIYAQYLNPNSDWQQDEIEVFEDGYTKETALLPQTILFPGVTSSEEAHKRARYLMACTRLQFWTYTFRAATSHMACQIGDRIKVTHDAIFAGLGQARISRVIENENGDIIAIRLDAAQEFEEGRTYGIRCLPDGETELHLEVTAPLGLSKELTLVTPIAFDAEVFPERGNQIQFGEFGFESIDCVITEITPAENFTAQITCTDYNEAIYAADTQPIPAYTSRISETRNSPIVVPSPVVHYVETGTNALMSTGSGVISTILISVQPQLFPVANFETLYKRSDSSTWEINLTPASSSEVRLTNVIDNVAYDIKMQCRRADNWGSGFINVATNLKVIGKTQPPPDVPGTVYRLPFSTVIGWFYDKEHGVTVPLDFAGFVLKMGWGSNRNWDQGVVLSALCKANQYDLGGLAKGRKTIMIKAVDSTGNEQEGPPAYIDLDFGDVIEENLIYTIPITSAYPGISLTDATWDGTTIRADSDGSLWWGDDDNAEWFPDPQSGDWFDQSYKQAPIEFSYTPPTTERKPFRWRLAGTFTGNYKIEYRLYGQSPWFEDPLTGDWWDGDLSDPWWDELDPQWLPLPEDGLEGTWQRYDVRITLFAGSTQGTAGDLAIVVDVPDIVEEFDDFIVDNVLGKRLPVTNIYRKIANVQITMERNPSLYPDADSAEYGDKDISGPLIHIFDAAKVGTTGLVDVIIKGY